MEEPRHSAAGIASFVLSLASLAFCLVFIGELVSSVRFPSLPFVPIAAAALVLGIVGLVRRGRKRLFAILGTVLSAVVLIVFVLLVVWLAVHPIGN